ncbi:MAG: alcohol dehydrogenase catalytic domain-containing protein, partial [Pseudomonadota bacterium]|nr:alcohol dehydrogenase catalytic domain-containing protein [Pseudomonadota bacterium]
MDVLRLHSAGDIRLHSEPEPVPSPGEELVRVTAVGLCGSDLHWFEGGGIGDDRVQDPFILGHEMGGVIASGASEGERVVIEPANPCRHCDVCRAGHSNLCQQVEFCGHYPTPGGLSTFMVWPRRLLVPVPETIEGDEVALLEPLGIALHAIDLGHFRAGMSAGVYGCGPIGLFLIKALRAAGAGSIQASDALFHRLEAARAFGADDVRLTDVDGQPEGVECWGPVDVAFEAAGENAAVDTALRTVRTGGRVVIVGIPSTDRTSFGAAL